MQSEIADFPRCHQRANWTKHTIMWQRDVICKTESTLRIGLPSEEDWATATGCVQTLWWNLHVWFLKHAGWQTDRQTNRHADWNIFDYVMQLYWTSVFWSYTHYSVVVVLQVWWTSLFVRSPQTKMSNFHLFYYFATTPMGEVIKHTDVLITILRNHSHGWSIVMSTSVCVCVCLSPGGYIRNHSCDFCQIFCACCL